MPVEIRELVIKTEIKSVEQHTTSTIAEHRLNELKTELIESCKRMITESTKRKAYNR
ncbi:DUF5908 family protein [Tenacibaculum tangerinum]|uniref:DUF5908 family protein n=1 Tax=Tenacibaculum tangerinum TaxID=3038772 RepID=A0ABY8L2N2_9FLAO|nr:DUF5908 family protein [Tenacibaculum tangerinum]WGH75702.1 DUF5908 family protein [Tenacibaculum tangerinum]